MRTPDSIWDELVPPPGRRPGVCETCQTWNDQPTELECSNCHDIRRDLQVPALPISVLSLYKKPSLLRDWLSYYKGRPEEGVAPVETYRDIIRDILADFFDEHWARLVRELGNVDALTVVPSTTHPGPHVLESVVASFGLPIPCLQLLTRGPGALGFRQASKDGFIAAMPYRSLRVLVLDDVYTTGARLNSAAEALRLGGADVVNALVIARRVNPGYSQAAADFWQMQHEQPYDIRTSPHISGATSGQTR